GAGAWCSCQPAWPTSRWDGPPGHYGRVMQRYRHAPIAACGDTMHWTEAIGYIAAALTFATFLMKTMIPLRIVGISANCFFIVYGFFAHVHPALVLHLALLPLNGLRLYQMLQLVEKVKAASQSDAN